jgi:hypothetical protein
MGKSRLGIVLALLLFVVGLALVGTWARRSGAGTCALDGQKLERRYQVRIVDDQGRSQSFCCLRCAELWLAARSGSLRTVYVTDEVSEQEIEAGQAWFVRSSVVTRPTTGNRVHAFRDRPDAERHAEHAHGILLLGADRPFADR